MDQDLVTRAQRGDQEAFGRIVELEREGLRRLAFGILRDLTLADDATQQALLEAWRDLPGLRDPLRFGAWLHRLLVRRCYAEAKRSRDQATGMPYEPTKDTADPFRQVADRDQLERGFRRLSVDQRTALVLHYYRGLSIQEVAEVLDQPTGTVSARIHRALDQLRGHLEADDRTGASEFMPREPAR